MHIERHVELSRELQAEHIASRNAWVRYVELKTAIYRAHVTHIQDELAPIVDDLLRHEVRRSSPVIPGR